MLARRSTRKASLDRGPLSPKGWMKPETDGVGLAIVADLEKAQPGPSKPSVALRSRPAVASGDLRVAEFLRRCYLCRQGLHGKDIYIYRGEKAFCSIECRSQEIASDERTEKHRSRVLRRANVSSSSHCDRSHGRLFFTGAVLA